MKSILLPLRALSAGLCLLLTFSLCGCGGGSDGPKLSTVSGVVTVNGEPVSGLTVYFEPADGATSQAATDAQGRYTLIYPGGRQGALPGQHTIRIIGRDPQLDENILGEIAAEQGKTVEELKALPVVPKKFNVDSELTYEVIAGSQVHNIDLEF